MLSSGVSQSVFYLISVHSQVILDHLGGQSVNVLFEVCSQPGDIRSSWGSISQCFI